MIETQTTLPAGALYSEVTLPAGFPKRSNGSMHNFRPSVFDIDRWHVSEPVCDGHQSILYLAQDDDGEYAIVKFYNEKHQPVIGGLKRISSLHETTLAPLLSFGRVGKNPYEAMPYFANGTLDGVTLSEEIITTALLPQLNTAIHTLHQIGILHNDIKPSNVFYRESEDQIALGDYDTISLIGSGTAVGGTLAFLAPEVLFSRGKGRTPASDYCSLGLTLIALVSGKSPLAGLDMNKAGRMWQRKDGIPLPEGLSPDFSTLLRGLTRYNAKSRLDYESICLWLSRHGIRTETPHRNELAKPRVKIKQPRALKFKDNYVLSIDELVEAIGQDWEHGTFLMREQKLNAFLIQFDPKFNQLCHDCASMFEPDEGLFTLIQSIAPHIDFYWKGKHYANLREFVDIATSQGIAKQDSPAVQFCRSGMLVLYLEKNGFNREQIEFAQRIQTLSREDPDLALTQLSISMSRNPEFPWHGEVFRSLDDVARWLLSQSNGIDQAVYELYRSKKFEAWLDFIQCGKFISIIQSQLQEVFYE